MGTGGAQDQIASAMVLRGAAGAMVGAASSPRGQEGLYGVVGFAAGTLFGELGILTVAMAALYRKSTTEK